MKIKTILLSGLLVGSLDILAAFVDFYLVTGNGPSGVLRFIASSVFGKAAFNGSSMMIIWGLLFHYFIAYSFTILFFWLYRRIRLMTSHPILTSILYSIFMWVSTVLILVPSSNAPAQPLILWNAIKAILILFFMISIPLRIISKRVQSDID